MKGWNLKMSCVQKYACWNSVMAISPTATTKETRTVPFLGLACVTGASLAKDLLVCGRFERRRRKQICLHNRDKSIKQFMLKPDILCPDTITILNTLQSAGHSGTQGKTARSCSEWELYRLGRTGVSLSDLSKIWASQHRTIFGCLVQCTNGNYDFREKKRVLRGKLKKKKLGSIPCLMSCAAADGIWFCCFSY